MAQCSTNPEPDNSEIQAAEDDRLGTMLEKHAEVLAEHFESVRIIAVRNRNGMYARITRGAGNYFSQYGSIRDWLLEQDQSTRNLAE